MILKKENLDLATFATSIRINNRLDNLKIDESQVDSFLESIAIHCFRNDIDEIEFLLQIYRVCSTAEYYDVGVLGLPEYIDNILENRDNTTDKTIS